MANSDNSKKAGQGQPTTLDIICIDVKIITIKIEIPTNRTKKFSMELNFLLK